MNSEKKKINWPWLRSNACPKCGKDLQKRNDFYTECSSCDFSISNEKLKNILTQMENQ